MAETIELVSGDNRPYIRVALKDSGGTAINISDATTTVQVFFRRFGEEAILATIPCTKVSGSAGEVVFNFPGDTLDVEPGRYEGEIELSFDGEKQTVYAPLKFKVRKQFA